jgi:hypothetical protein
MSLQDLLFVGFNGRVVALERSCGELVWEWKVLKPTGRMIAILVDGDCVFASSDGYTYCLDALTGQQLWYNPLKGMGTGTPCLATAASCMSASFLLQARAIADQQAAAHSSQTTHHAT